MRFPETGTLKTRLPRCNVVINLTGEADSNQAFLISSKPILREG